MFPKSFTLGTIGKCQNNTIILGENNGDGSGRSVSSIRDLNSDGKDELIVGAVNAKGPGATYVVSGNSINLAAGSTISLTGWNTAGSGIVRLVGENNGDQSGFSVSSIGDLNSDGKPELIIGAPRYSGSLGATYIVSGANINLAAGGSILLANYAVPGAGIVRLVGENSGSSGYSVSSIRDLDADGKAELLIGAVGYSTMLGIIPGATYIVSGANINLAAGGSMTLTLGPGIVVLVGENNNDQVGVSVSTIEDLNGDGEAELLIGAVRYPLFTASQGATYIVSGASINLAAGGSMTLTPGPGIVRVVGENPSDFSGFSVSSIGDLNSDGKPELLIGATGYPSNTYQGATYVVSSTSINLATGGSISLANYAVPGAGIIRLVGETIDNEAGWSVSSIGDLNSDGKPELLISAPVYPSSAVVSGATYVVSGASINLAAGGSISLAPAAGIGRIDGENNNDASGFIISSIGDLNGDGKQELVIGAYSYLSGVSRGATYVISGNESQS